jgi:hypothetical protein
MLLGGGDDDDDGVVVPLLAHRFMPLPALDFETQTLYVLVDVPEIFTVRNH